MNAIPKPISKKEFYLKASLFRPPLELMAAFRVGELIYVLVHYWPKQATNPQFVLERYTRPDELLGFTEAEDFVRDTDCFRRFELEQQISILRRAVNGEISYGRAVHQMKAEWTWRHYHQKHDESDSLDQALKKFEFDRNNNPTSECR